jgi:hypothetical protein
MKFLQNRHIFSVKMYHIVKRDFCGGKSISVYQNFNLRETENEIEVLALSFVALKEGDANLRIYPKSKSGQHGRMPFGFYCTKSIQKFSKLTIFHKYLETGYVYNTTQIKKIISFQIIFAHEVVSDLKEEDFLNDWEKNKLGHWQRCEHADKPVEQIITAIEYIAMKSTSPWKEINGEIILQNNISLPEAAKDPAVSN